MMKKTVKRAFIVISLLFLPIFGQKPKITVVFVVDQFGYHYIPKLRPFFTGGIKTLLENGISYSNAYVPHAMPATATGHAGIATGTFANMHGIIGNRWFDENGNNVYSDQGSPEKSAVFGPNKLQNYGKSSQKLKVDTLSDQLVLKGGKVVAISLKSRAAIMTAGSLGKAIWFDDNTGIFTSSKAYFKELPNWLKKFNQEYSIKAMPAICWQKAYPNNTQAYNFPHTNFGEKPPLVGTKIDLTTEKNPFKKFTETPYANKLMMEIAKRAFQTNYKKDKPLLLWISISGLDKIGHLYGPQSLESIDMLYHIDKQIGDFIEYVTNKVKKDEVLFALTADHGVAPIPELMQQKGYTKARRIVRKDMLEQLNDYLHEKHEIKNIVHNFKMPQFFLNTPVLETLPKEKQKEVAEDIISFAKKKLDLKNAWTFQELRNKTFRKNDIENFYKQQLFAGRSGQITVQPFPYTTITSYKTGTGHRTPYNYDTHIPLILYQPNNIQNKIITQNVWFLQLANTLADILKIPRPSASKFEALPF